jgi:hypothetical protein
MDLHRKRWAILCVTIAPWRGSASSSMKDGIEGERMHVLVTVVILAVGFVTGYVVAVVVYDRVRLWT